MPVEEIVEHIERKRFRLTCDGGCGRTTVVDIAPPYGWQCSECSALSKLEQVQQIEERATATLVGATIKSINIDGDSISAINVVQDGKEYSIEMYVWDDSVDYEIYDMSKDKS
jgi:hypothetical protein